MKYDVMIRDDKQRRM